MTDDLFDPRLTEHRNPRSAEIDRASPLEIVDLINAEDSRVPGAVHSQREEIARAMEIAVECFRAGGRLIWVGAGTSGRLGVLDATECPPTFGVDPERVQGVIAGGTPALTRSQEGAEDATEDGAADIEARGVGSDDFVFGVATSSTTPYVRGALRRAAELGARTGFLCCTEPDEDMSSLVDICIVPLVGPEVVAGSTRMKAGTATKLVLNTITTGAMIRLGKVYGNLMVDVQAISEKLIDRSRRIIMAVTGRDREGARTLLEAADGSVKRAIVMDAAAASSALADLLLVEADGFVWRAIATVQSIRQGRGENPYRHYPVEPPGPEATGLLMAALGELPKRLRRWLTSDLDVVSKRRPGEDGPSLEDEIRHLADIDERTHERLATILQLEGDELGSLSDERVERIRSGRATGQGTVGDPLDRLAEGRARLLETIGALGADDWSRIGHDEAWGRISIYQILRHLARHDHDHMESIRGSLDG